MVFRRALLFVSVTLAVTGTTVIVTRAPDHKMVVDARGNGYALEPRDLPTAELAPETTTTTPRVNGNVAARPPRGTGGVTPSLPTLPRAPSDPCATTLVDEDVANATDEGTYEIDRSNGAFRLVARSHGIGVYNPDGKHVAYVIDATTNPRMCVANRDSHEARTAFVGNFIQASVPNFPTTWANANLLVFAQVDSLSRPSDPSDFSVFGFDLVTLQLTRIAATVSAFAVSPSGKSIAYAVPHSASPDQAWSSGSLYVMPIAGGPSRLVFSNPSNAITEVRWSQDENTLAVGDPLYLVDVASGDASLRAACGDGEFGGAWSPLEARFAFAASFDPSKPVCAITPDTTAVTELGSGGRPEDWSPGGDHLLLNALTDFTASQLTTVLSELTISDHQTRQLFSYVSQASEPHFFDAEYAPDGKTIRFCNKVAI